MEFSGIKPEAKLPYGTADPTKLTPALTQLFF